MCVHITYILACGRIALCSVNGKFLSKCVQCVCMARCAFLIFYLFSIHVLWHSRNACVRAYIYILWITEFHCIAIFLFIEVGVFFWCGFFVPLNRQSMPMTERERDVCSIPSVSQSDRTDQIPIYIAKQTTTTTKILLFFFRISIHAHSTHTHAHLLTYLYLSIL